jgi:hypothetical protein
MHAATFPRTLALFNLGGGEIILVLVVLGFFGLITIGFFGTVYLIIRAVQSRPSAAALPPAPAEVAARNRQQRDEDHLNMLSIFHFVFAGLALLGIAFLCVHYLAMHSLFASQEMWKSPRGGNPPPPEVLHLFVWFYVFGALILALALALNLASGMFLRQKRNRTFSLVIGAMNCLQVPFGTALGVFTIVVLSRDSVRELYFNNQF